MDQALKKCPLKQCKEMEVTQDLIGKICKVESDLTKLGCKAVVLLNAEDDFWGMPWLLRACSGMSWEVQHICNVGLSDLSGILLWPKAWATMQWAKDKAVEETCDALLAYTDESTEAYQTRGAAPFPASFAFNYTIKWGSTAPNLTKAMPSVFYGRVVQDASQKKSLYSQMTKTATGVHGFFKLINFGSSDHGSLATGAPPVAVQYTQNCSGGNATEHIVMSFPDQWLSFYLGEAPNQRSLLNWTKDSSTRWQVQLEGTGTATLLLKTDGTPLSMNITSTALVPPANDTWVEHPQYTIEMNFNPPGSTFVAFPSGIVPTEYMQIPHACA
jgi:hypothetical protein